MSRTALSPFFIKFHKAEQRDLMIKYTEPSDREDVMEMYEKSNITPDDMSRKYTPAEVRELAERTKVRVNMHHVNIVWDAKKRFDAKKRLENKSSSWVNRMYVKALSRGMIVPYTDLEMANYKEMAAFLTKKENNILLDCWHRQRAKASLSNDSLQLNSISSEAAEQPEPEERPEQPEPTSRLPDMPILHVELVPSASSPMYQ